MKQALSSVALQEIIPAVLPSSELHVSAPALTSKGAVEKSSEVLLLLRLHSYTCQLS